MHALQSPTVGRLSHAGPPGVVFSNSQERSRRPLLGPGGSFPRLALLFELDQRGVEPLARIGVGADELLPLGPAERDVGDHALDPDQLGGGVELQPRGVERVRLRVIGRPPRGRGEPFPYRQAAWSREWSVEVAGRIAAAERARRASLRAG